MSIVHFRVGADSLPFKQKGREYRARYSQYWLLRMKSLALVLAQGTHQTRWLFGEIFMRYSTISLTTGVRVPASSRAELRCQRCQDICAHAQVVTSVLWTTSSCVFDGPRFRGLGQQHADDLHDSHDAMRSFMWHKDQKSVCALVLAIVKFEGIRTS